MAFFMIKKNNFLIIEVMSHNHLKGWGEEVQGQKSWKHDFEIAGDPKGSLSESNLWLGFEAPNW